MVTPPRPARAPDPPPLPRWAIALAALMAIANLLGAVGGGLVRLGRVDTGLEALHRPGPLKVRIERITD